MSPKIGMTVRTRALLKRKDGTPAEKVNAAVLAMREQGITLTFAEDCGALPCPFGGGWCLDPKRRAVNILGALVLTYQPEVVEGDTCLGAAGRVLGPAVEWAYVYGLADGWERSAQSNEWLRNIMRQHYLAGYEAGMEARFRATVVCRCGARRFRDEEVCPGCDGKGRAITRGTGLKAHVQATQDVAHFAGEKDEAINRRR